MTLNDDDVISGLFSRVEQIASYSDDKFPLLCKGRQDEWVLSNGGSWMGGFWYALQKMFVKRTLQNDNTYISDEYFPAMAQRFENLLDIDSVHTSMVFWHALQNKSPTKNETSLLHRSALKQASRFDERLGFIPLGEGFTAGPTGKFTLSVDSLAALIKLLTHTTEERLQDIAHHHADFYSQHGINHEGASYPSWLVGGDQHDIPGDWSRGQAWAIYGLVTAANQWPNDHYKIIAEKTLHYWLSTRGDSLAPNRISKSDGSLDPSANVIVALAMYEFAGTQLSSCTDWKSHASRTLDAVLNSVFFETSSGISEKNSCRFCGCAIPNKEGDIITTETIWGHYLLLVALSYRQTNIKGLDLNSTAFSLT